MHFLMLNNYCILNIQDIYLPLSSLSAAEFSSLASAFNFLEGGSADS